MTEIAIAAVEPVETSDVNVAATQIYPERQDAAEELTPVHTDPWSGVPFGLVDAKLLLNPASAGRIAASTVRAYRLPAKSVRRLRPQVV